MPWRTLWIKHRTFVLWTIIVLAGLVARLLLAWSSVEFLITNLLPDDAFYYFKIAENIARGDGSTFDGMHLTNGYHPFWMGICIAIYKLFQGLPRGATLPIHVLLSIASILNVALLLPCIYILKRLNVRPVIQMMIGVLYLCNPWTIAQALNGLESALVNTLLLVAAAMALRIVTRGRQTVTDLGIFSALAALTILARLDYALMVAFLGLYLLWKKAPTWKLKQYLAVFGPGGAVLIAWSILSWRVFGALIPQSGFAFSLVNKTLFFYKPRSVPTLFLWSIFQWVQSLKMAAYVSGMSWALWMGLGAFGIRLAWEKRSKQSLLPAAQILAVLIVGFIGFTFLQGALRWSGREWYFSLGPILGLCAFGYLLEVIKDRFHLRKIVFMIVMFGIYALTNELHSNRFLSQGSMYQVAMELSRTLDTSGLRIGAYNAGIYGYYAGATIVNLDGLVNISAYHALRDKRMYTYLQDEKIDYILDYAIATNYRYAPFWGKPNTDFLIPVRSMSTDTSYHGSTLMLFKVVSEKN